MSAAAATVATMREVTKTYNTHNVIDRITIELAGPRITGLLGRNGAGKTTLLHLLTGRLFPDRGTIEIYGQPPAENPAAQAAICFVKEAQYYPENIRAAAALEWAGRFQPNWSQECADRLMDEYEIPPEQKVHRLSRGQRSALTAITGLAARAPITIFDEPYLGMDPVARQQFYSQLLAEYAAHPRTILLSTHLIDEVSGLLEHVMLLDRGQLLATGSPEQLAGSTYSVGGPAAAVAAFVQGKQVLHQDSTGSLVRATVTARLTSTERAAAADAGLDISPLSLQQFAVASALSAKETQQ